MTAAILTPADVGAKATATVHVAAGASNAAQPFCSVKTVESAPVTNRPVTAMTAVPAFETLNVCSADVVPANCDKNATLDAEIAAMGIVPVPLSAMFGLPLAFVCMPIAANLAPALVGAKVTVAVQVAAGARLAPQVVISANIAASGPVKPMPDNDNDALPVFVTTINCLVEIEPVRSLPYDRTVVLTDATGASTSLTDPLPPPQADNKLRAHSNPLTSRRWLSPIVIAFSLLLTAACTATCQVATSHAATIKAAMILSFVHSPIRRRLIRISYVFNLGGSAPICPTRAREPCRCLEPSGLDGTFHGNALTRAAGLAAQNAVMAPVLPANVPARSEPVPPQRLPQIPAKWIAAWPRFDAAIERCSSRRRAVPITRPGRRP